MAMMVCLVVDVQVLITLSSDLYVHIRRAMQLRLLHRICQVSRPKAIQYQRGCEQHA